MWTKISSLEIIIFGLKMMVKRGLESLYFEILRAPSEIPANLPGQFSLSGQISLHWATATLKGLAEFQNKNSRPLFLIIFKSKMIISRLKHLVGLLKGRGAIGNLFSEKIPSSSFEFVLNLVLF